MPANPQKAFSQTAAPFAYGLLCLLFVPLFVLVCRDRHAFPWDDAFYAASSVSLFKVLVHSPFAWPSAMVHALADRPPGISWLGQFFVPLGRAFPFVQSALLIFVLLTNLAAIVLLFRIFKEVFGRDLPALLTAGLLAAGPLLTAMTYRYLVEPLQMLTVVWVLCVAAFQERLSRLTIVLHVTAAVAFGLLVKTSTGAFQAPALVYLAYVVLRGPGEQRPAHKWDSRPMIALMSITAIVVFGTAAWYSVNYRAAMQHVVEATSGSLSIYYGSRGTLGAKLVYWTGEFQRAFFWQPLLIFSAAMLPLAIWGRLKKNGGATREDALALISLFWIAVILILFARSVNEDSRYLLALLPYVGLVVCWILANLRHQILLWAFAGLAVAQFTIVTSVSFGLMPARPTLNAYLAPYVKDPIALRDSLFAAQQTADSTAQHQTIVGTELIEFNSVGLTFYSAVEGHRFDGAWRYMGIDFTQTDANKIWNALVAGQAKYYVYRKHPAWQDADVFNRQSRALFEKVSGGTIFTLRPDKSNERVLVYERSEHGRPRYRLAAGATATAPTQDSYQGVDQAPGLPFGFVDTPKPGSPVNISDSLRIDGWTAAVEPISRVEVLMDGKRLQNALPAARPDVASAYIRSKTMGFTATVNLSSVPDGLHTLSLVCYAASGASRTIAQVPVFTQFQFSGVNPDGTLPFGLLEYPTKNLRLGAGDPLRVLGWTAGPSRIKRVEILVDGKDAADAAAMARPDVAKAYPNLKSSGFSADLKLQNLPAGAHKMTAIEFSVSGAARQMASVAFSLDSDVQSAAPKGRLPFGTLDLPQKATAPEGVEFLPVAGWAASASDIASIEILIDGHAFAKGEEAPRPDVKKAYPGLKIFGFNNQLNLSSIVAGTHQLSVVAHTTDGSERALGSISFIRDVN